MGRKILWHSCAPWVPTGYGSQTALFAPRIADLGYDVACSAFFGLAGSQLNWTAPSGRAIPVYPAGQDGHSNDVMGSHLRHWAGEEPSLFLSLTDVWVLWTDVVKRLPAAAWVPVDHDPAPPEVVEWFERGAAVPIAMSRFGQERLRDAELDPLYVPHGYDPAVFYPRERAEARARLGFPQDAFVVGVVAANVGAPSRKGFSQALEAFARFAERAPDARLYMHTNLRSVTGENLARMVESVGVVPLVVHQYRYSLGLPSSYVADVMSACDVLLNPSHGEGFGIPILEAMACGTPAIATDFSSMPELVGDSGWLVGGQRTWTAFNSWQMIANVEEIVDALVRARDEPEADRAARRERCLERASWYAADRVLAESWAPALEEACRRVDFRRQTPVEP